MSRGCFLSENKCFFPFFILYCLPQSTPCPTQWQAFGGAEGTLLSTGTLRPASPRPASLRRASFLDQNHWRPRVNPNHPCGAWAEWRRGAMNRHSPTASSRAGWTTWHDNPRCSYPAAAFLAFPCEGNPPLPLVWGFLLPLIVGWNSWGLLNNSGVPTQCRLPELICTSGESTWDWGWNSCHQEFWVKHLPGAMPEAMPGQCRDNTRSNTGGRGARYTFLILLHWSRAAGGHPIDFLPREGTSSLTRVLSSLLSHYVLIRRRCKWSALKPFVLCSLGGGGSGGEALAGASPGRGHPAHADPAPGRGRLRASSAVLPLVLERWCLCLIPARRGCTRVCIL